MTDEAPRRVALVWLPDGIASVNLTRDFPRTIEFEGAHYVAPTSNAGIVRVEHGRFSRVEIVHYKPATRLQPAAAADVLTLPGAERGSRDDTRHQSADPRSAETSTRPPARKPAKRRERPHFGRRRAGDAVSSGGSRD